MKAVIGNLYWLLLLVKMVFAEDKAMCLMPADAGPCKGYFTHYFYNSETGQCETFVYGGCEGNGNNFETMVECEKNCPPDKAASEDCRVASCRPCHDCLPNASKCTADKPCDVYSCQNRCKKCELCSEVGECYDPKPRWCKFFKPCQERFCQRHPAATCEERVCDCFNVDFRLPNGTVLTQQQCAAS